MPVDTLEKLYFVDRVYSSCRVSVIILCRCQNVLANLRWASKSQIQKFLGSLSCRKSANFLDMPVCKSQNRKFSWYIRKSQICKFLYCTNLSKNLPKIRLLKIIFNFCTNWIRVFYALFVRRALLLEGAGCGVGCKYVGGDRAWTN